MILGRRRQGLRSLPGKTRPAKPLRPQAMEREGPTSLGQACLVARRLVERGVPYITINNGGWDTHTEHFRAMQQKLPELDQGLGDAARGSVGPWTVGEHSRLVPRRIRPHAQDRLATALERRTEPLRQGLLRRGRRRRVQGRTRRGRVGCEGRRGQGSPRLPLRPAWAASMS